MTSDRIAALAGYSDDELLAEVQRRRQEAQRRLDRLSLATGGPVKMPGKSAAKTAYWAEWKAYRSTHPSATVAQWQRSRKRGKG
jgi:hypothetical protein